MAQCQIISAPDSERDWLSDGIGVLRSVRGRWVAGRLTSVVLGAGWVCSSRFSDSMKGRQPCSALLASGIYIGGGTLVVILIIVVVVLLLRR